MLQEISRRKFMELTGAGALLLTSAGMMTGCCREYPTLFGEWIDMGDLRIRFSRAFYIQVPEDGTAFGCTVKIKAKDATQTITLKKDDFTIVVNGTERLCFECSVREKCAERDPVHGRSRLSRLWL